MSTISCTELEKMLAEALPNNIDRSVGYALVNVSPRDEFLAEHIPDSINIPRGLEQEFEQRFDKSKNLVLYCSGERSNLSRAVAAVLIDRGFSQVSVFNGGLESWKRVGREAESGEKKVIEIDIA